MIKVTLFHVHFVAETICHIFFFILENKFSEHPEVVMFHVTYIKEIDVTWYRHFNFFRRSDAGQNISKMKSGRKEMFPRVKLSSTLELNS